MEKRDRNKLRIAVAVIFALAIFFSLYRLTESPPFWYDEGWYFQSAGNLANAGAYGIQFSPGEITHVSMLQTVSYPLIYPLALWFKIFGTSVFTGRLFMAIIIILLLAAAYCLSKTLFGWKFAVATLAILTTFPPLYGNGKSVLGETPGLLYLFAALILWNIAKSAGDKKYLWLILSGLFAGLCLVTKPMFFLLAPALLIGIIVEWRRRTLMPKDILVWIAACIAPFIIWMFVQITPGESLANLISYYASPYSYNSTAAASPGMLSVVWQNFKSIFNNMNTLYTLGIMLVWVGSLFVRKRSKAPISGEEMIAFCFALLVCLAFLRIGIVLRYLFAAQVVALVFFPNALSIVFRSVSSKINSGFISAAVIAILSIYGLYQASFDSYVAEAYTSRRTEFWQTYFTGVPATTSVFFYDTPEVVPFKRDRNYYQLLLSDRSSPLGKEGLKTLEAGGTEMVVVETSKYVPLKESLFKSYVLDRAVYRYSILKRKL